LLLGVQFCFSVQHTNYTSHASTCLVWGPPVRVRPNEGNVLHL